MASTTLEPDSDISGSYVGSGSVGQWGIVGASTAYAALSDGSGSTYIASTIASSGACVEQLETPSDGTWDVATAVTVNVSAASTSSKHLTGVTVQIFQSDGVTALTNAVSTGNVTTSQANYAVTLTPTGGQTLADWTNAQLFITVTTPANADLEVFEANVAVTYTTLAVPSAPSSPSLSSTTSTTASLTWTQGVGGTITDNKFRYSTSPSMSSPTPVDLGSAVNSGTITGLTANTFYFIQVSATNSDGDSSWSRIVVAFTGAYATLTPASDITTTGWVNQLSGSFGTFAGALADVVDAYFSAVGSGGSSVSGANDPGTGDLSSSFPLVVQLSSLPGNFAAAIAMCVCVDIYPGSGAQAAVQLYQSDGSTALGGNFEPSGLPSLTSTQCINLDSSVSGKTGLQFANARWSMSLASFTTNGLNAAQGSVIVGYTPTKSCPAAAIAIPF